MRNKLTTLHFIRLLILYHYDRIAQAHTKLRYTPGLVFAKLFRIKIKLKFQNE